MAANNISDPSLYDGMLTDLFASCPEPSAYSLIDVGANLGLFSLPAALFGFKRVVAAMRLRFLNAGHSSAASVSFI